MTLSKSLITNLISAALVLISFLVPEPYYKPLLYGGLFALSGALTNHLAIYMLFHKVPLLYGSGIIELKFESFKASIKELVMKQFFSKEQLEKFFAKEEQKIDLAPIVEETDFSPAYEALSKSVMESQFGAALNMFGGESALEKLKEPFIHKLKSAVVKIVGSEVFKKQLHHHITHSSLSSDLISSIDKIVTNRLNELTPQMVKELIEDMMREHLGWLVVWGGVFGGLIGVISSFLV